MRSSLAKTSLLSASLVQREPKGIQSDFNNETRPQLRLLTCLVPLIREIPHEIKAIVSKAPSR